MIYLFVWGHEGYFGIYFSYRLIIRTYNKLAKESFFKRGVEQNRGDSGKLWSHLKSLGHEKKASDGGSIVLEENGHKIFDSASVANVFNKFYTSVASTLVSKLPSPYGIYVTSGSIFRQFYSRKLGLRPNFTLSPVSSHFIRSQLHSLNPKKAIGLDDISSLFLRDGTECIVAPITHIVNLSIITETVPTAFKDAKVGRVADVHGHATRAARTGLFLSTRDHRAVGYRVPTEWGTLSEVGSLGAFKRGSRAGFLAGYPLCVGLWAVVCVLGARSRRLKAWALNVSGRLFLDLSDTYAGRLKTFFTIGVHASRSNAKLPVKTVQNDCLIRYYFIIDYHCKSLALRYHCLSR